MKEKQSLFSLITGNWQHFLALVVLMVIAFAVSIFAEKLASKKDLKEGKPVEREIYSQEQAFTEFDDLSAIGPRGY